MGKYTGDLPQLCYKQEPHHAKHAHFIRESPLFTSPLRRWANGPGCEYAGQYARAKDLPPIWSFLPLATGSGIGEPCTDLGLTITLERTPEPLLCLYFGTLDPAPLTAGVMGYPERRVQGRGALGARTFLSAWAGPRCSADKNVRAPAVGALTRCAFALSQLRLSVYGTVSTWILFKSSTPSWSRAAML
jgi:hypothetical protein